MPEFVAAVRALVGNLRKYFRPHGEPPQSPTWQVACAKEAIDLDAPHPLDNAGYRLAWLLGNPEQDALLGFCVQSFRSLRLTALTLKKVESLLAVFGPTAGQFRQVWQLLLETPWCDSIGKHHGRRYDGSPDQYHISFTSAVIDKQLLTDLIGAAELVRPDDLKDKDASADTKKKTTSANLTG